MVLITGTIAGVVSGLITLTILLGGSLGWMHSQSQTLRDQAFILRNSSIDLAKKNMKT